jgi:hypothetical protein
MIAIANDLEFSLEELIERCLREFSYNSWINGDWNELHPDAVKDLFSEIKGKLDDREVIYSLPKLGVAFNFALMEKAAGTRVRPGDKVQIKNLTLTATQRYDSVSGIVTGCAGQSPWWETIPGAGDWKLKVHLIKKNGELSTKYKDVTVMLSKCELVQEASSEHKEDNSERNESKSEHSNSSLKFKIGQRLYHDRLAMFGYLEEWLETEQRWVFRPENPHQGILKVKEEWLTIPEVRSNLESSESIINSDNLKEQPSGLQRGDMVQFQDGRVGTVLGIPNSNGFVAVEVPCIDDPEYEYERPLIPVGELKKVEPESASVTDSGQNYTTGIQTPALFGEQPRNLDTESDAVCDEPPLVPTMPSKGERLEFLAEDTRVRLKRSAEDIYQIGANLLEVRELCEHGEFTDWLDKNLDGMTDRSARNFMSVAKAFEGKTEIISDLRIAPTVLYKLAAPDVPEPAREEIINRATVGERISVAKAKQAIARHKKAEPKPTGAYVPKIGELIKVTKGDYAEKSGVVVAIAESYAKVDIPGVSETGSDLKDISLYHMESRHQQPMSQSTPEKPTSVKEETKQHQSNLGLGRKEQIFKEIDRNEGAPPEELAPVLPTNIPVEQNFTKDCMKIINNAQHLSEAERRAVFLAIAPFMSDLEWRWKD